MKNQKIFIPFILSKSFEKKHEMVVREKNKPNYLILKPYSDFVVTTKNKILYKTFANTMGKKIYTHKRYENQFSSLIANNIHAQKLNLMLNMQRKFLCEYINDLKINVRLKLQLQWNFSNKFGAKSSYHCNLPNKLNLSLINDIKTNYQEYQEFEPLNKSILGVTKEFIIFDNYSTSGIELEDLMKRGLQTSDVHVTNDGKYFVEKHLFFKFAKVNFIKEKVYLGSSDLEWTLSNYKSVVDDSGKSIFYNITKSNQKRNK